MASNLREKTKIEKKEKKFTYVKGGKPLMLEIFSYLKNQKNCFAYVELIKNGEIDDRK